MVRIHHHGPHDVRLTTGRYPNGRLAVQLTEHGEPFATVSVNIPEVPLARDEFFVKVYSENEGLLDELLRVGAIHFTGRRLQTHLGPTPVYRLPAHTR